MWTPCNGQESNPDTLDFANVRNYRIIFATPCQGVLFMIVFLCGFSYISFMTNLAFDTYNAVKDLEQAGMPVKQAESVVATLRKSREFDVSHLATKMDLNKVKSELKADIAGLKTDMATLENRLTLRLGAMLVASIAIIAALVRFLQSSPIPS